MAKNRMTFEKTLRERKKKQKAEEKRALRKKRKEQAETDPEPKSEPLSIDELSGN